MIPVSLMTPSFPENVFPFFSRFKKKTLINRASNNKYNFSRFQNQAIVYNNSSDERPTDNMKKSANEIVTGVYISVGPN